MTMKEEIQSELNKARDDYRKVEKRLKRLDDLKRKKVKEDYEGEMEELRGEKKGLMAKKKNHSFEINGTSDIKFTGIKSASKFARFFRKGNCKKRVVLFVDEYDVLYEADDDVKASFLRAIHDIKNAKDNYSLWSFVAIGPLNILHLSSNKTMSLFNVKDPFQNPNFIKEQVQHARLVYLYGKAIYADLIRKLDERRRLDFLIWLNFTISLLQKSVFDYATFRKMIIDNEERNLAEFLTAEGVLIRDEEIRDRFKMSSVLTIVLKLLATATKHNSMNTLYKYLNIGISYLEDIWIVHFTCEDNSTQNSYYPSNEELSKLNIVHFLHDEEFK
ncbi:16375_t:CDS:2, partial [Funneliformis caledonium]